MSEHLKYSDKTSSGKKSQGRTSGAITRLLLLTVMLVSACNPTGADLSGMWEPYETGIASWYGEDYHGSTTANGETYDMESLTAAHRTLPFNTMVRVINREDGSAVTVRINNRGPFVEGRVIDLSRRGAREIGIIERGLVEVDLYIMSRGDGHTAW